MADWIEKQFSECFRLRSGDGLTSKAMVEGAYPVYGGNGIAGMHNDFNLTGDNVIIGRVGALCGIARHITKNIWLTDNAFKIVDFKYDFANGFLTYLLNFKNLRSLARQAAQPVISNSSLKDLVLKFPVSITEQKRIVTILDEAFAAIDAAVANTEKNLANARELFESYLNGVFTRKGDGWVEKTIKEITSHLGDGLHGTPMYTDDGEYYFINGNNLDNGKIVFKEKTKKVSVSEYEKHKKNLTDKTILVSINGTLGNVAFYNNEKIILGKSACYFNVLDEVDKHFIKYIISSPYFLDYAHREATGATIKNVSLKSMRGFKVPLPPLTKQNKIVRKLDRLSKQTQHLETLYQQKLTALAELKQSILQKAFAGELTAQPETEAEEVF